MKHPNKSRLLPFYFGSLTDDDRLAIERELLTDEEVLLDYFDLKRNIEAARMIPAGPSASLWSRLQPRLNMKTRTFISISIGAAIAAGLAVTFFLRSNVEITKQPQNISVDRILFDSSSEQSVSSGVL